MKKICSFLVSVLLLGLATSCSNQNRTTSKLILPHSESTSVEGDEASEVVDENAKPASVSPTSKDEYQIPESADFIHMEENDIDEAVRLFNRLNHKFFDRWNYSKEFYKCLERALEVPECNLEYYGDCEFCSSCWLWYIIDQIPHADSIIPREVYIHKISNDTIDINYKTLVNYYNGEVQDTTTITAHLIRENGALVVDELETRWGPSLKKVFEEYITETRAYLRSERWEKECEEYRKEHGKLPEEIMNSIDEYFKKYPD